MNVGSFANDNQVIFASVSVLVGDNQNALALKVNHVADKCLAVERNTDIIPKLYLIGKNGFGIGVRVKVFALCYRCGSFLPIVVIGNADLCVFCNNRVQTIKGKVCYFFVGAATLFVDVVSAVSGIYTIHRIHSNTRVPSLVVPLACANVSILTSYGEVERALVACERVIISVFIVDFVVFLLQSFGQYVLLA